MTSPAPFRKPLRLLITAGPTREPIDAVRFISNRSSGQMGSALISAGIEAGHKVTAILGPVSIPVAPEARRIDVETTRQMYEAVMRELPGHDVLIMAAAVADYRPTKVATDKLAREKSLTLELEATEDIVASAAAAKRPDQRIVGFSLEQEGSIDRARAKLQRKKLDIIIFNPLRTMDAGSIQATILYADGREIPFPECPKPEFARRVIDLL